MQNDGDFVDVILLYTSTDIRAIKSKTRESAGHVVCIINNTACLNASREDVTWKTWAYGRILIKWILRNMARRCIYDTGGSGKHP
jgi:hypothetical protein